jgi:phage terminase large subunit-like protein
MLMFGLRLGDDPRCAVATTPRATPLIRELIADESVAITRGSTYENRSNLAPAFFAQIIKKYEGTRLGRQELLAELLLDVPGALWTRDTLEKYRTRTHPPLVRIVVAIDPAASANDESSETGIVVAGMDGKGHGYVLDDLSMKDSPAQWGETAVLAFDHYQADRIIGETNNGGDMVEHVVRTAAEQLHRDGKRQSSDVAFKQVRASRGKHTRAEPVAALDEQGRIHHVGMLAQLEDQLCTWIPGEASPDRLDARVWAITELMLDAHEPTTTVAQVVSRDALEGLFGV